MVQGNQGFPTKYGGFPVTFPLNQSIDEGEGPEEWFMIDPG